VTVTDVSLIVPLRCGPGRHEHGELADALRRLAEEAEVLVVDGSDPAPFEAHARWFGPPVRHVRTDPRLWFRNGKVDGVTTGVRLAANEAVVIADDDVRYRPEQVREVAARLRDADLAVPRNAFDPRPWHARWDTARTLVNLAFGWDYPGTLAIRRSSFLAVGGYDGDVLFENLELMRTIRAAGGDVVRADAIVRRVPPSPRAFLGQRVRQAYDSLAQPGRLAAELAVAPLLGVAVASGAWVPVGAGAAAAALLAELGRRRRGGRAAYPGTSSLFAPAWVLERGICSWIALGERLILGGCRYRGVRIRRAATPMRVLRRRARERGVDLSDRTGRGPGARRASRRRAA
jgi:hypothetical protein